MKLLTSFTLITTVTFASSALAENTWTASGFIQPESSVFDPLHNQLIVSNINGGPLEQNAKGFLSLVSPEGQVKDLHWFDGLDAPKGMAIIGDQLFVSDVTQLRVINTTSGKIEASIPAQGAVLLNDVTASHDTVWVSDMMTHSIWRYHGGQFERFVQDEVLNHPNGLYFDGNRLVVATWGQGIQADFSTQSAGGLMSIDLETKIISPIKGAESLGNLDSVTRIGNTLVTNDWITGKVYAVKPNQDTKVVAQYATGLADISFAGTTAYLPMMMDGKLRAVKAVGWVE